MSQAASEVPAGDAGGPVALRSALSDLVHRYAAYADQRRVTDLAALFVSEGQLVLPTPPDRLLAHLELTGRAAIATHMAVLDSLTLTSHQVVGEVYDELAPGQAGGRVACVAHHVSGERDVVWHLHYDDSYVLDSSSWRIRRRELHVDFIQSLRVSSHR